MRILNVVVPVLVVLAVGAGWSQDEPAPPAGQEAPLKVDPAKDLWELALLTYREASEQKQEARQRETYLAAIKQFDRFHGTYPNHENALKSWYFSAVCYQKVGDPKSYRGCLSKVVTTWKEGPLVGAAAYQLAHEHYLAKQYDKAAPLYELAAGQTDHDEYRHKALYSRALCHQKLEQRPETIAALLLVLRDEGSPFHESAERVLAHYYKEDGKKEEALAHFLNLTKSDDRKTKADAILQCALLSRDLEKKEFSQQYFELILTTPGLEEWRGEAQLSLMSAASREGNHRTVIDYYKRGDFPLDQDPAARRLQLAADAYEQIGEKEQATALLRELAKVAPDSMTAFEAGYVVLSREYKTGGRNLVRQAEDFLRRFEGEHPDDARIHNTRLMLAEAHFQAKRYGPAAKAYAGIDLKHVATENHPGLRYRLATALLKSGQRAESLAAFETYIANHPGDSQVVNAVAHRAEILLEDKNVPGAHQEFDRLLAVAQDPALKEYAWAQKAILYKEAEDLENFARCQERLLADFPERDARKRAASEFWLGWAHYRLKNYAACLGPFQRAREGDPGALGRESTLHLAQSHYLLKDRDNLKKELDRLLQDYPTQEVNRSVFSWLGRSLALEEDYVEAWRYLKHAITPDTPAETTVAVWRAAGRSALEAGAYEESLRPLEIVLQVEDNDYRKAETNFLLARAHFKLKDPERARKAAEACLELRPQGDLNAHARLLLGDVAMSQGDPNTAAQHYVVVVEFYGKDPEIVARALRRAVNALELKGGPEAQQSAQRYRKRLESLKNDAEPASRD